MLHTASTVHASKLLTYISFDTEFQWYESISDGQRSDESIHIPTNKEVMNQYIYQQTKQHNGNHIYIA